MSVNLFLELSHAIIGACFNVHNYLGACLPEAVYHRSLEIELECQGNKFASERYFPVHYKGQLAGQFFADLVVKDKIILELKSTLIIKEIYRTQLLNYLKLSGLRVGYIINFYCEKVEFERFVV
ncbi:MAG: GxxExxY protein [Spirochaetales bacterium]|nr:GxxExxY protein [Spirochaetales bacterium]